MNIRQAYNAWAEQYDTNENKTRDLEALTLKDFISGLELQCCLEIGCGTGKNTVSLLNRFSRITAVDFSEQMLSVARQKLSSPQVEFIQADITLPWSFADQEFELVTFSLVLEHIQNLEHIFSEAGKVLKPSGLIYIGELHPFKQYSGSKARFETSAGTEVLECYNHHISDFILAAKKSGLVLKDLAEYFDDESRKIPRILRLVFIKP